MKLKQMRKHGEGAFKYQNKCNDARFYSVTAQPIRCKASTKTTSRPNEYFNPIEGFKVVYY